MVAQHWFGMSYMWFMWQLCMQKRGKGKRQLQRRRAAARALAHLAFCNDHKYHDGRHYVHRFKTNCSHGKLKRRMQHTSECIGFKGDNIINIAPKGPILGPPKRAKGDKEHDMRSNKNTL